MSRILYTTRTSSLIRAPLLLQPLHRTYQTRSASSSSRAISLPIIPPRASQTHSNYPFSIQSPCKMSTSTTATPLDRYKLIFFVPPANLEPCKEAIFATGAGTFPGGKYTKCCFQTRGQGQFLPNEGANPAIGAVGVVEQCEEVKVEIMCLGREVMVDAVRELVKAHPYEEVAYEVYRMEDV